MRRARALADELLGTCGEPPDGALDDPRVCQELDALVMRCDCCGWWVETHEVDGGGNCDECREHCKEWSDA